MWRATRSAGGRPHRRTPRGHGRTAPACGVRSLRARRARLASRRHGRGLVDPRRARANLLGHVKPPARPVHRGILPEVRELQCGAHGVRRVVERIGPIAAQAKHDAADRIGRTAAVVEHVVPGRVARDGDVLLERAEQIGEKRLGRLELLDGVEKCGEEQGGSRESGVGRRRAEAVTEVGAARPIRPSRYSADRRRRSLVSSPGSSAMSSAVRAKAYTAATCGRRRLGSRREATGKFS